MEQKKITEMDEAELDKIELESFRLRDDAQTRLQMFSQNLQMISAERQRRAAAPLPPGED
jgi:hypothetical protein